MCRAVLKQDNSPPDKPANGETILFPTFFFCLPIFLRLWTLHRPVVTTTRPHITDLASSRRTAVLPEDGNSVPFSHNRSLLDRRVHAGYHARIKLRGFIQTAWAG